VLASFAPGSTARFVSRVGRSGRLLPVARERIEELQWKLAQQLLAAGDTVLNDVQEHQVAMSREDRGDGLHVPRAM
jgi:hypothetical protein